MNSAVAEQVIATPAAEALIETLRQRHGLVLFHQSGGCCDGSSPMCYPQDDFIVGDRDVKLGEVAGAPFYISPSQFEYWKHTQLIIDVVPGRGGMFSLENGEGVRFLTRSRLFDDDEVNSLIAAGRFGKA
jgi:uncharacterized protein (DUF779 family)